MLHGWPPSLGTILTGSAAVILCLAALYDIAARIIPDWIPIALTAVGIVERLIDGRLVGGLAAGALVFVMSGLCWRRGWLGGGDVKLLGAAAVAMPPAVVPPFAVAVALAGGVISLIYLALGYLLPAPAAGGRVGRQVALPRRLLRIERWRLRRGGPLPYAVAIAAGGLLVLL